MAQICEAVYQNGVFRPIAPAAPGLAQGQHVRLVVETHTPEDILRLAAQVYEDLSEQEVDAIEQVALIRKDAFAVLMLEELASERRWDEAFARSQDNLAQLAAEAMAEHRVSKTRVLNVDEL